MLYLTFISLLIFVAFNLVSIKKFGIQKSYSTFSTRWNETGIFPEGVSLWSIVTVIVAMLITPATIEAGEGNYLQFLGFFAPLYLILVGLTPDYETNPKQHKVHIYGAWSCAILAFAWMTFVLHLWFVPLIMFPIWTFIAYKVNRKDAYIYWLEMVMFSSVYATLIINYI